MKDNKIVIIVLAAVILILLGGGGYYISSNNKKAEPTPTPTPFAEDAAIPTLKSEDLGLTLSARDDGKAVKFTIANPEDIESVDYELSYLAAGGIPRGAIGRVDINRGESEISTKYIDLGTCSSGKCKYDEGVTSVTLVLKINKSDGKTYVAEKSLDL